MPQIGYARRQAPMARDGMVSCCHPLASLAGVDVLRAGGNVVDAAIATNAVLAVTQPNYCGLGGDLFCLYYEAESRRVHFLNGAGRSGSRAGLEELARRGMRHLPPIGPATVSVPGCIRGWFMLHERFGTRAIGDLLQPAIHYAERGTPFTSLTSQSIRDFEARNPDPEWRRIFMPGERVPQLGEVVVQADLARPLRD